MVSLSLLSATTARRPILLKDFKPVSPGAKEQGTAWRDPLGPWVCEPRDTRPEAVLKQLLTAHCCLLAELWLLVTWTGTNSCDPRSSRTLGKYLPVEISRHPDIHEDFGTPINWTGKQDAFVQEYFPRGTSIIYCRISCSYCCCIIRVQQQYCCIINTANWKVSGIPEHDDNEVLLYRIRYSSGTIQDRFASTTIIMGTSRTTAATSPVPSGAEEIRRANAQRLLWLG